MAGWASPSAVLLMTLLCCHLAVSADVRAALGGQATGGAMKGNLALLKATSAEDTNQRGYFEAPQLRHPLELNSSPRTNQLFWVMRGKKSGHDDTQEPVPESLHDTNKGSQIHKRQVEDTSIWSPNSYLLGKRPYKQTFWTARGKKADDGFDSKDVVDSQGENYNFGDDDSYDRVVNYAMPYVNSKYSNYEDDLLLNDKLEEAIVKSGKRHDRLFWVSRGKRQDSMAADADLIDDGKASARDKRGLEAKLSPQMKQALMLGKLGENSKFWMSRGRRFWTARGKKATVSPSLGRLSRFLNSNLKDKDFYAYDPVSDSLEALPTPNALFNDHRDKHIILDTPNFWVVRGKKSDYSSDEFNNEAPEVDEIAIAYDESWLLPDDISRYKKPFDKFSALSQLSGKSFRGTPNFWASRGRKNFWAARGK